ncbi:hypothetical protein RND81_14G121500 [Saponaria officinalis]|uniref:CCHC-type domain-containing protein n=1 Tax=Saponaria officinalis TaxID=3572 RepID=A0AAW1GVE7_SAPOF
MENIKAKCAVSQSRDFEVDTDGSLKFRRRWCVPDDNVLKEKILREAHNTPYSVHPGGDKMYKDLRRHFWWPSMKKEIAEYVARCLTCQKVKFKHQRPGGLLQPLEIPVWKWDSVSMDFITIVGIDSPIYMALRDNRLQTYKDSLLAVVQTNVCNGPVYFNCFPDYTVDLSDPLIQESLILDLHVSGNKFKEFAKNFAIVFRIYFRLMSSTINPKFIHEPSSKEETIFIEVHAKDNNTRSLVTTAKALPWDKITIPEILLIPKEPPTPNMIKQDLDQIEEDNKRVLLRFGSFRESTLTPATPSSSFTPPRKSCSSQLNSSKTRYTVYNKTPIPEYEATSSPPQSPTASDFQSVNTITEEFEIDKEYLRNDFNSSQNSDKIKWFLSFEKEIKDEIRDIWYKDMRNFKINIPFFLWFDLYCQKIDIINPFSYSSIQVQSKLTKNWTLTDGRTVTSVHPPPKSFKFSQGETEVEVHPYKVGRAHQTSDPVVVNDIIKIYQQNNYSNQILQTIASKSFSLSLKKHDEISQIKAQFDDDQEVNRVKNRRSWQNVSTRNYYPRPSPPDMQYEERSKFTAHTFSPNVIHEWNIDVFSVLIASFTGQLKNWWGNSLTLDSRLEIYNHTSTQINEDNMEVEVNDCCDYLIVVIAMYFVGNPMEELSSQKLILTNLRCPTLGDYRWYKDIFLTYVLRRPDCNEGFWMKKFVSGLPKHFSQRIFRKLKESFANEVIAWQTITYGQLFAFYQSSPPKYYQKRRPKRYPKKQNQNKEIICFKCGKPGHKADKCFTKNKINELFQDNPEMCQKLSKLFLNSSSSEAESNDEINIIQESSDDESYDSASSSPILMVNVISDKDDKTFLFDLIDKVDDPDIKRYALLRLKSLVIQEHTFSKTVPSTEPFSISKLFELVTSLKQLQQELNSLKTQVNDLRNQLQNIHVNESELDLRLSALEHKNTTCSTSNESSKNKNIIEDIIAENIVIEDQFVQTIQKINFQKWYAIVTFKVRDFQKNLLALIDSGADQNYIRYGLVPHKYYETTKTQLYSANNQPLNVKFKHSKATIVNDGYCFHNTFIVTKENFYRAEMSKNKGKTLKTQTGGYQSSDDYEMDIEVIQPSCSNPRADIQIPKAPTTPIKTSNTFNPLLTQPNRPALPYSQALQNQPKTQKEKEALIQNTSPFPGYFVKSTFEPLILTKYRTTPSVHEFRVNNSKIFAQGIHWFSDNISKNQRFYEFILLDSGSADIKHERDSTGKISYSKIIINKVNSSDDWIEPFAEKDFSKRFIPQTYSYNDYKNAWSRALLLEDFDHSWFITFNKLCPQRFPIWFYQWWYLFGPDQAIYPPICTKGFETFVAQTKVICLPEAVQSFLQGGRKLERAVKDFNRQQTQASSSSSARPPQHPRPSKHVKQLSEERLHSMKQMVKDPIFRNELLGVIRNQISEEEDDDSAASSSSNSGFIHIYDDHVFGGPCSQDPFE